MATAKIKLPLLPSPIPITLTTFAVFAIGASFEARLGLLTIADCLVIGALGFDVFANSSSSKNGSSYTLGGTGGYLAGFLIAAGFLGWAARSEWDCSPLKMSAAMLIGNVLIYVPGLLWLRGLANSWVQPLD